MILYKDSTNILKLSGLRDNYGQLINDATVNATLYTLAGAEVVGQTWPLTLTPTGSSGTYEATLSHLLDLQIGKRYYIDIVATSGSIEKLWRTVATCQYAS